MFKMCTLRHKIHPGQLILQLSERFKVSIDMNKFRERHEVKNIRNIENRTLVHLIGLEQRIKEILSGAREQLSILVVRVEHLDE